MDTRSWLKRALAGTLTAFFCLMPIQSAITGAARSVSASVQVREGSQAFTLDPRISDGVEDDSFDEGDLTVYGHVEGSSLVFDETRTICFTVRFEEGWSYSSAYSVFFPGDERASVTQNGDGSVTFTFSADEGGSVELSVFRSAAINAVASELPKLYIDAVIPFDEIDKTTWIEASYRLTLGTKEFDSGEYEGTGFVKGRGNSSWQYPKKPYSIKLDKKESLLDIPKTKKYAIVPSYYDGSLMRNFITYKAYQELIGIGYVPKCEFVDVYLNGEYNGIYILVERIDIEKTKVNIEEATAEDLTGGYLIEKDLNGRVDFANDLWFNCPYWANQAKDYFVMKAPEPDDPALTRQMLDYLQDYVNRIHDCIINENGEPYTDYVDTSSWVDFIIVEEVAKNIDGCMKTSCWMYKDRGDDHLYMTAPWDFDFAYGRINWTNASMEHNDYYDCPPADTFDGFMIVNSSNPWMDKLYDTEPEFKQALMERYTEYRHTIIDEMFAMINEQAAYLSTVQEANYALWHRNFAAGVNSLRTWLTGRVAWLDEQWLIEEETPVDLDPVLNIENGALHFDVTGEGFPFEPFEYNGIELAAAFGPGEHGFSTTADFSFADFIDFDYALTEGNSVLTLFMDGEPVLVLECADDRDDDDEPVMTNVHYIVQEAGEHTFRWCFTCEDDDGAAYIDNVSINFGFELGDADMSRTIDSVDALLALRYALDIEWDDRGALLSDMTGDGRVSSEDALLLLRKTLGIR